MAAEARDAEFKFLGAHTRNPGVLKAMNRIAMTGVLAEQNVILVTETMPGLIACVGGYAYHLDRYAPDGLYSGTDPVRGEYYENTPLTDMCPILHNPNNALVVTVPVIR